MHPVKRWTDRAIKKNEGYVCATSWLGLSGGQVAEPGSSVIAKGAVVIVGCNIGKCMAEGLEVFVSSCFSLGREVIATGIANTCVPGSVLSVSQALSHLILEQTFEAQMRKLSHREVK